MASEVAIRPCSMITELVLRQCGRTLDLPSPLSLRVRHQSGCSPLQGALAAYKAAADLAPDVAANPANCAAAALMLRRFKAAAEYAARAAALQPSFVRAHIRAGKACLCMGHYDQAGCCPPHQCAQPTLSKTLRLL